MITIDALMLLKGITDTPAFQRLHAHTLLITSSVQMVPPTVSPFHQECTLVTPRKNLKVLQTTLNLLPKCLRLINYLISPSKILLLQFWSNSLVYLWYSNSLTPDKFIIKLDWHTYQPKCPQETFKKSYHKASVISQKWLSLPCEPII